MKIMIICILLMVFTFGIKCMSHSDSYDIPNSCKRNGKDKIIH
jgi:hypothetical protein